MRAEFFETASRTKIERLALIIGLVLGRCWNDVHAANRIFSLRFFSRVRLETRDSAQYDEPGSGQGIPLCEVFLRIRFELLTAMCAAEVVCLSPVRMKILRGGGINCHAARRITHNPLGCVGQV